MRTTPGDPLSIRKFAIVSKAAGVTLRESCNHEAVTEALCHRGWTGSNSPSLYYQIGEVFRRNPIFLPPRSFFFSMPPPLRRGCYPQFAGGLLVSLMSGPGERGRSLSPWSTTSKSKTADRGPTTKSPAMPVMAPINPFYPIPSPRSISTALERYLTARIQDWVVSFWYWIIR